MTARVQAAKLELQLPRCRQLGRARDRRAVRRDRLLVAISRVCRAEQGEEYQGEVVARHELVRSSLDAQF